MGGNGHMNVTPKGWPVRLLSMGRLFSIWGGAGAILVALACGAVKRAPRCGLPATQILRSRSNSCSETCVQNVWEKCLPKQNNLAMVTQNNLALTMQNSLAMVHRII
jgi:hypothetical protein